MVEIEESKKPEVTTTKPVARNETSSSPERSNDDANANANNINSLYMFEFDPSKLKSSRGGQERDLKECVYIQFKAALNAATAAATTNANGDENKLEMLFSRCEALYSHGFVEHACSLAKQLALYCLNDPNLGLFNW